MQGASFAFLADAAINSSDATGTFVNAGTLSKTGGTATSFIGVTFNNTGDGAVEALTGNLSLNNGLVVNGMGFINTAASASITLAGGLTGSTRNVTNFTPLGSLVLGGSGTASAPDSLEVMGQDLGNVPAGFANNFVYGTLALSGSDYVQLVDNAHNSTGSGAEALYVNTLIVPLGTTLDLNGLHVYALNAQISGTVLDGVINKTAVTATQLNIQTQPPGTIAVGAGFGLTVAATDTAGDVASGYSGPVTVALNNPGGATLGGTLTAMATNGVASFTGLTLNTVGNNFTLQVTSGNLAPATTTAISVTTDTAATLSVTAQPPQSVVTGGTFGLTVTAYYAAGQRGAVVQQRAHRVADGQRGASPARRHAHCDGQ